jgi:hypothetical protein
VRWGNISSDRPNVGQATVLLDHCRDVLTDPAAQSRLMLREHSRRTIRKPDRIGAVERCAATLLAAA